MNLWSKLIKADKHFHIKEIHHDLNIGEVELNGYLVLIFKTSTYITFTPLQEPSMGFRRTWDKIVFVYWIQNWPRNCHGIQYSNWTTVYGIEPKYSAGMRDMTWFPLSLELMYLNIGKSLCTNQSDALIPLYQMKWAEGRLPHFSQNFAVPQSADLWLLSIFFAHLYLLSYLHVPAHNQLYLLFNTCAMLYLFIPTFHYLCLNYLINFIFDLLCLLLLIFDHFYQCNSLLKVRPAVLTIT